MPEVGPAFTTELAWTSFDERLTTGAATVAGLVSASRNCHPSADVG
jgi:hypothetical protein